MKAFINRDLVESRTKWAKRIAPLTMLFLVGGLITNFMSINQPEYFRYTVVLLALGFIFATISSYLVNRWVKEPRADQFLSNILKKFNNNYVLFSYTAPASQVLIAPDGVHVIVVKNQDGQITVNGRRFRRKFTLSRLLRFFADEGLGAPVAEVESGINKVAKLLRKQFKEEELPPVKPLIVFSNKNADITINEPAVPVVRANELKSYFREQEKSRTISADQRDALTEVLGGGWQESN